MEFVSRDSLVEEITGIKKDDMAWDSAKQTIANIDNALRKISSYNDTIGIPDFNKDSYIFKPFISISSLKSKFKLWRAFTYPFSSFLAPSIKNNPGTSLW